MWTFRVFVPAVLFMAATAWVSSSTLAAEDYSSTIDKFKSKYRDHCDVLLDVSFLTSLPSPAQVENVATMIEDMTELVSFGRCAVVAGEETGFQLGRMFQGFTWPLFTGIRLFRMNAEAIGWLDTSAD